MEAQFLEWCWILSDIQCLWWHSTAKVQRSCHQWNAPKSSYLWEKNKLVKIMCQTSSMRWLQKTSIGKKLWTFKGVVHSNIRLFIQNLNAGMSKPSRSGMQSSWVSCPPGQNVVFTEASGNPGVRIVHLVDQNTLLDCNSRGLGFATPALVSTLLTWARRVCCFYYYIGNLENLEDTERKKASFMFVQDVDVKMLQLW